MSLELIASPEKTVNGLLSNVNAGRSQLPYLFQREDYASTWVGSDAGFAQIYLVGVAIGGEFFVGQRIYRGGAEAQIPNGFYEITSIVEAVTTRITLNLAYTGGGGSSPGFLNAVTERPGYKVEIAIKNSNNSAYLIPLTFRYATEESGRLFLNVGQMLTNLQELTPDNSIQYILAYREDWEGTDEPWSLAPVIQSIYAKKQIGLPGGSNLWEYLLEELLRKVYSSNNQVLDNGGLAQFSFPSNDGNFTDNLVIGRFYDCQFDNNNIYENGIYEMTDNNFANGTNTRATFNLPFIADGAIVRLRDIVPDKKILTKFEEPIIWRGWQSSASFLIDTLLGNRTIPPQAANIRFVGRALNINKVFISSGGVNHTTTPPRILAADLLNNPDITPSNIYYKEVSIKSADSITDYSGIYLFRVADECPQPIMVEWFSSLGVKEYYLFSINQEVNIQASPGLAYEIGHHQDQENITRDKNRVFSQDTQSMILTAENLTNNQIKALAEIKTSTQVSVYLSKDGSSKIGVICREALASPYDSKGTRQEFRLVIEFPDNYDFFESKRY